MTTDDKIRDENNTTSISTEKQKKYQDYHKINFISINLLQVKKYYHLIKVE